MLLSYLRHISIRIWIALLLAGVVSLLVLPLLQSRMGLENNFWVAAYLKPEYARNYVQQLKKRGLDAYWSEAVSGDKKWYQVRVSHFASKQAARDYGQRLKVQGIIDDYYVANYRRQ
ncbi:MAG: SPOR domain-containing protein [bacterium]|nr:SPOR domain-containing protein [bacterium]